ncbi:hypothetical protein N7448_005739 [Penicillium atrosanguineum]|uniref:Uncharacterized protein n=1 Tax=Penicillium atrosanguineum TaxID=1132637 RepID=A0A9W9PMX9_9EURO|nr:uncharacterized protein N7443_009480 [Penicillium atrosanguineum]KAJ5126441.1 hypothetical protein N7526_008618 [Penicillium atrosanguineum]KAJ5137185.1 hypothetical protein N7448_005739 [Penicillium atrosanguineum]KAJ5293527.1 hypothetical protein N7443_009480 [Penicillium atrosanguineum]KAJ5302435.1 hypothetical protein N7476_009234 [Penicillium atrosanguineum]
MPYFKSLLLIALSLAATTMAASCPQSWSEWDGQCCYGSLAALGPTKYCCVQGTNSNLKVRNVLPRRMTSGGNSDGCFTQIPFTASDYSEQVSSASSQLAAGATTTPATNEATPTSSGSAAATTNAAMPIAIAQEIVLGGAAVIAGLFVL